MFFRLLFLLLFFQAAQASPLAINVGGGELVTTSGQVYVADSFVTGGRISSAGHKQAIANTEDDAVYQTSRFGDFRYAIPLENGGYRVTIQMAEVYFNAANKRQFALRIEGALLAQDIDLYALAGKLTAYDLTFSTQVVDGVLDIEGVKQKNNPLINGIVITPDDSLPPPSLDTAVYALNSGYNSTPILANNLLYQADNFFSASQITSSGKGRSFANSAADILYHTGRYARTFTYRLPVANGDYQVTLHFAETYFSSDKKRIFSVDLEGEKIIQDLDIFAVAGGKYRALEYTFDTSVSDGYVDLAFTATVNNAYINAITIKKQEQNVVLPPSQVPAEAAARLLQQATFGTTMADIAEVQRLGYEGWIDAQLQLPTSKHLPYLEQLKAQGEKVYQNQRLESWWLHSLTAPDQLRQRVAFALSQIFVVSDNASELKNEAFGMANYYDLLAENAFGNYRELLEKVTLSPIMANYLTMIKNEKPNPKTGRQPDENYAREVLQLFSIGLWELNLDGTRKTDRFGLPIPTYNQDIIVGFAHVFTGWNYADATGWRYGKRQMLKPLQLWPDYHATGEKLLLNGVVLPAGQSGEQDLQQALDNIFAHPNVGPFISKQLIQRLVTSNPSPAYVRRVAKVFNNNGQGVRGDLGAVVKAILLDAEARNPAKAQRSDFGKLREPLLQVSHLWRAFAARADNGKYQYWNPEFDLGQAPLRAPSVFNFYFPDYAAPGVIADSGLVAPESQLAIESTVIRTSNWLFHSILTHVPGSRYNRERTVYFRTDYEQSLIKDQNNPEDTEKLLDHLALLLLAGDLSETTRQTVKTAILGLSPDLQVRNAIYLLMNSPDYKLQR